MRYLDKLKNLHKSKSFNQIYKNFEFKTEFDNNHNIDN